MREFRERHTEQSAVMERWLGTAVEGCDVEFALRQPRAVRLFARR
ncbi:hypothetical protein [Amycolatopsis sp. cmx-11-12]